MTKHPAAFSDTILTCITKSIDAHIRPRSPRTILDPFAGIGRIHTIGPALGARTVGIELEPEWARQAPHMRTARTIVGDTLTVLRSMDTGTFDAAATSPCYGNRMADHHENRDACSGCNGTGRADRLSAMGFGASFNPCPKCGGSGLSHRRSYRHDLGRMPTEGSSAVMQWGDEYKAFHAEVWAETYRVVRRGGLFCLNIKDHVRKKQLQRVPQWHRRVCVKVGWEPIETWTVPHQGMRYGENHESRSPNELVYVFRKP